MSTRTALLLICLLFCKSSAAQYWPGDTWYNNPLGFEPLALHTSMSFLVPAAIAGAVSIFTKADTSLENKLSIFNESGVSWGYKYPYTLLSQNNTGINYQLRRWLSIGAEFSVYVTKDGYNNAAGFSLRPFARFYAINGEKFRLYFESGGGLICFTDHFPKATSRDGRTGTYLNGNTKYGIGAEVNFTKGVSVISGLRHVHVSNGNTKGAEMNPSHDSNGFFLGFSYRLQGIE